MNTIPGFWDVGPHAPFPVEDTWQKFVRHIGGTVVEDVLPNPRKFENADFYFPDTQIIAELKEIQTEFSESQSFVTGFGELMERVVRDDPAWRPALFGGDGRFPPWFRSEFIRLFRPPISRVLKKANRQIRDTKEFFGIRASKGVLLFVNDGFQSLGPEPIQALACSLLADSYSSIDCFIYLTANSYVSVPGDSTPRLVWAPVYSDRAPEDLQEQINHLGRSWFDFIETLCEPYTDRVETDDMDAIAGAEAIRLPKT